MDVRILVGPVHLGPFSHSVGLSAGPQRVSPTGCLPLSVPRQQHHHPWVRGCRQPPAPIGFALHVRGRARPAFLPAAAVCPA